MKRFCIALIMTGGLAACNAYNPTDRAIAGGLVGAGTGAVIGGVATRSAGGAVAGAVIGGAGGAIIGAATTPNQGYRRRSCRGYNDYGEPVRFAC